ncbi:MAG: hypothetical protein ACOX1V_02060 [Candidatus Iainarchaeum sp.]
MTKVKTQNYWINEQIGKYYLLQYYISHCKEKREEYIKLINKLFKGNSKYLYKKNLAELNLISNLKNERNIEFKGLVIKQRHRIMILEKKINLSNEEKQELKALKVTTKKLKTQIFREEIETLDLPLHFPRHYFNKEIEKSIIFGLTRENFEDKVHDLLWRFPFDETLKRIKSVFGKVTLRNVLLGITLLAYLDYQNTHIDRFSLKKRNK